MQARCRSQGVCRDSCEGQHALAPASLAHLGVYTGVHVHTARDLWSQATFVLKHPFRLGYIHKSTHCITVRKQMLDLHVLSPKHALMHTRFSIHLRTILVLP